MLVFAPLCFAVFTTAPSSVRRALLLSKTLNTILGVPQIDQASATENCGVCQCTLSFVEVVAGVFLIATRRRRNCEATRTRLA